MAREVINIGTRQNDRTGDSWRVAATKINNMTDELYAATAGIPDVANILTVDDLVTNLTTTTPGSPLDATMGKSLKDQFDALTAGGGIPPIANNLTTTTTGSTLDATQGKILKDITDAIIVRLNNIGILVDVSGLTPGSTTDITTRFSDGLTTLSALGGGTLFIPAGAWMVQDNTIVVPSNVTIKGIFPGVVTLHFPAGTGSRRFMLQTGNSKTNIRFEDLAFSGSFCDDCAILIGDACVGMQIRDIVCTNAQLVTAGNSNWDVVTPAEYGYGLVIERCSGTGNGLYATQGQFIFVRMQWNWVIRDCRATNYNHGAQWWGGDAAFLAVKAEGRGDLTNIRKCGDGLIENCDFVTMGGAGVWGAMGNGITVRSCFAMDCGDICFDAESCDNVLFDDCTAVNAKNALFASYFAARNVKFARCRGTFTSNTIAAGGALRFYNCWNVSNDPRNQKDVVLENCTFESTVLSAAGNFPYVAQDLGPTFDITVKDCKFRNGAINLIGNQNTKSMIVEDNIFEFDMAPTAVQRVITVGRPQYTTPGTTDGDYVTIANANKIRIRSAAWPTGSSAIHFDYSIAGATWVWSPQCKDNEVKTTAAILTYAYHIRSVSGSSGSRIRLHFGGNTAPEAYTSSGTIRDRGLFIDDATATTPPVQVIAHGRNKSSENGIDFGPVLTRTLNMVKIPTAITGGNTIAIANTSNLQIGDTVRMTGATNAANNNTNFRISGVTANTSITVTSADGLNTTPLTNETPPGSARLYKRILAGTKRLVTVSAVGSGATVYAEAGTGVQALSRSVYEVSSLDTAALTTPTDDDRLEYSARCYMHGELTIYVENPHTTDVNCADVTLYVMMLGRVQ